MTKKRPAKSQSIESQYPEECKELLDAIARHARRHGGPCRLDSLPLDRFPNRDRIIAEWRDRGIVEKDSRLEECGSKVMFGQVCRAHRKGPDGRLMPQEMVTYVELTAAGWRKREGQPTVRGKAQRPTVEEIAIYKLYQRLKKKGGTQEDVAAKLNLKLKEKEEKDWKHWEQQGVSRICIKVRKWNQENSGNDDPRKEDVGDDPDQVSNRPKTFATDPRTMAENTKIDHDFPDLDE